VPRVDRNERLALLQKATEKRSVERQHWMHERFLSLSGNGNNGN
jgi:hypothetical protein